MQIIAEIRGEKQLLADLNRKSNQFIMGIETALDETAKMTAIRMKTEAPMGTTGDLMRSIDVITSQPGLRVIGPGGGMGSRGSPLPKSYAIYVEEGANAHWPNVSDIANRMTVSSDEAFLIARAISRRCMLPVKFAEATFEQILPIFERVVESMVVKVVS